MESFSDLALPAPLSRALAKMGFNKPTPIQAAAIPAALLGRDILGTAQTGTGKTGAFGIPLVAHLHNQKGGMALVMTPTRELAAQVIKALQQMLGHPTHIHTALLIGGESMYKQLQQLKTRPRLIVGTPGRINDHLQQRSLHLDTTDFLVLDETDRMLDMGFDVQIERILKYVPRKRQTLLFSATLPPYIVKLSEKYLHNPQRIAVGATHTAAPKIQQELLRIPQAEKYAALLCQLKERKGSIIVFVKTKRGADKLAKKLNAEKLGAEAIHGNLSQNKRTRVIQAFRDKQHRILIATDVASRGLDIPHIEHVINYDLPQVAEDYIHRIGRTARAGAEGSAVCFITPEDGEKWREIHHLMNPGSKPAPTQGSAQGRHRPQARGRAAAPAHKKPGSGKAPAPWQHARRRKRQKSRGGKDAA